MTEVEALTMQGSKQQSPIKPGLEDTLQDTQSKNSSFLNSFVNQKSISQIGPFDSIPAASSAGPEAADPPAASRLEHKQSGAFFGNETAAPHSSQPTGNDETASLHHAGADKKRDTIGFSEKVFEQTQKKQTEAKKYKTDIYLWGRNHFGQLGLPDQADTDEAASAKDEMKKRFDPKEYYAPVIASFDIAIQTVECGEEHTAVLSKDGEIWMIGSNQSGQLGVKRQKGEGSGRADAGAANQSLASFESFRTRLKVEQQSGSNDEKDCKHNKYFAPIKIQLPTPEEKFAFPQQIDQPHIVTKLACGDNHTLALTQRGHVYSWGQARYGALGLDFNLLSAQRNLTQGSSLRQNVGLKTQMEMYALGGKFHHSAKDGPGSSSYHSLNFKGLDVSFVDQPTLIKQLEMEIIFEISAGAKHSCFAALSNKVFACGSGQQGQLGLGTYEKQMARKNQYKPADDSAESQKENADPVTDVRIVQHLYVPDTHIEFFDHVKIKQISCGRYHTLFLTQDGEVYACGQHTLGQLGLGRLRENDSAISSSQVKIDLVNCIYQPRKVELGGLKHHRVQQISAWTNSACVTIDKDLFVWGSGVFGDSDQPKLINMAQLMKSKEEIQVDSVQLGGAFMTIKDVQGNIYCWGNNYHKEVRISPESLLTKKIPKKLLKHSDKVEGFAAGGAFAIAYTKWREVESADEEQWIGSRESQRADAAGATGADERLHNDNQPSRDKAGVGRHEQQISFGSSPEASPEPKARQGRRKQAVIAEGSQANKMATEKKRMGGDVKEHKANNSEQVTFDNLPLSPENKEAVKFQVAMPSTAGHQTIEEGVDEASPCEKSLMSYNNDSELQAANPDYGNPEQKQKPPGKGQAQKYVKSKPKNAVIRNSKSIDGQRRNRGSKRGAAELHAALSKLPMPKTQLIKNLMNEVERRKDYDKLTEQVNQLLHDNRELKSQLLTLMQQSKSQDSLPQRSASALPMPTSAASISRYEVGQSNELSAGRKQDIERVHDRDSSSKLQKRAPEAVAHDASQSQKLSQTEYSLYTHLNVAQDPPASAAEARSQQQPEKSAEESSKSHANGSLSFQNLEGGDRSFALEGPGTVRPPVGQRTKIHSILSDDNMSRLSEASGMSIYKNLSYVKYKEEKDRQRRYKGKNDRLSQESSAMINVWPGRNDRERKQMTEGAGDWQQRQAGSTSLMMEQPQRSGSRGPTSAADQHRRTATLEQPLNQARQKMLSLPDMAQNCLGQTFSTGAIGPSALNSAVSADLRMQRPDASAAPLGQHPSQPGQPSPDRSPKPSPYHQQASQQIAKESVPLAVSGSGSISVKSDSAFNQTLLSIRETINRCKQRRSHQELRHEYEAHMIDKGFARLVQGERQAENSQAKTAPAQDADKSPAASNMLIVESLRGKDSSRAEVRSPEGDNRENQGPSLKPTAPSNPPAGNQASSQPVLQTHDLATGERAVYQHYTSVYQMSFSDPAFQRDEAAAHRRTDVHSAAYIAREHFYKSQDDKYRAMMEQVHGSRPLPHAPSAPSSLAPVASQPPPSTQQPRPPASSQPSPSTRKSKILDRVQNIMQSNGLDFSARLRVRYLEGKDGTAGAVGGDTGDRRPSDGAPASRLPTSGDIEQMRTVNDINESANRIEQMINTASLLRPEEARAGSATMRHGVQKSVRFELSEEKRRAAMIDPFADAALSDLHLNKELSALDYLQHAQQLENIINRSQDRL